MSDIATTPVTTPVQNPSNITTGNTTLNVDDIGQVYKTRHGIDIVILFTIASLFTLGMMILQYILIKTTNSLPYKFPIDIFVTALTYAAGIFGGFEGTQSFLKSASLDKGKSTQLPEWKIHQLLYYIIVFIVLLTTAMVLQYLLKDVTPSPDFAVTSIAYGFAVSFIVYVAGRTGSKLGENFDFLKNTGLGSMLNNSMKSANSQLNNTGTTVIPDSSPNTATIINP
jgi:hypothetical protein